MMAGRLVVDPRRDDDDGQIVSPIPQEEEQVLSVARTWHVQVQEDEIDGIPIEQI